MGAAPRRKPAKRVSKRASSNRVKSARGGASKNRVSKAGGGDTAVVAKDVIPEKVKWYWRGRLPSKMITLIAGRPDQGKGLVSAHIAADISRRGGNVIYSAIEDDNAMMTRPRLESAGADLNRILFWRFGVPEQMEELEHRVLDANIRLIVMDPLAAHLTNGVSQYSDSIRKVTNPLSAMCERTGCSVIVVAHALKKVGKNAHPLSAIGGSSSGLPAAARMAFLFGVDPDDADRRILCSVKANVRTKPKPLAFETSTTEIGLVGEVPNLVVQGECEFDPLRLLSDSGEPTTVGRRPDKKHAANEWLTERLWNNGDHKPVKANLMLDEGTRNGHAEQTLKRAAKEMEIVKTPPQGGPGTTWELPNDLLDVLRAATAGDAKNRGGK